MRALVIVVITIIILGSIAGGLYYMDMIPSFSNEESEEAYTPPPLDENPPMNGDSIDAIARQMEEQKK